MQKNTRRRQKSTGSRVFQIWQARIPRFILELASDGDAVAGVREVAGGGDPTEEEADPPARWPRQRTAGPRRRVVEVSEKAAASIVAGVEG